MDREGGEIRQLHILMGWTAPALWAVFAWSYTIVLSQLADQSFLVAIRGTGIVQYPSSIVVLSPSLDRIMFVGLGILLLVVHSALLRFRGCLDPAALLASAGLAVGLVGYAFLSPLFIVLVGASAIPAVLEDCSTIAHATGATRRVPLTTFFVFAIGIIAAVAVAGAARWVVGGFDGSTPFGDPSWNLATGASQVIGLVYPILPELTLLFFFSWAIRLAFASELHSTRWVNDRSDKALVGEDGPRTWGGKPLPVVLLLAGIVIAFLVGVYPYLRAVNPSSMLVGVDVRYCYSYWLKAIPGSTICGPAGFYIGNERYGALWFLQGLVVLTSSADVALKLAPAVWGALLVVSTYLLVNEGTGDGFLAGVSALLTGVSMQVVAGIDAGILANWLGLSFAYLFLATILHGIRTKHAVYLIPSFAFFAALLFIHPWTWAMVVVVLTVYLGIDLLQSGFRRQLRSRKFELALVGALLALGLGVDLVKSTLPSGSGLIVAVQAVIPSLSPTQIPQVASSLEHSLLEYLGGAQANPVWFVLGVAGVLAIPTLEGRFGKLLFAWVGAMSIGVLLVAPDDLLQARMIYDVPLQIFAALGLVAILDSVRSGFEKMGLTGKRLSNLTAVLAIVAVVGLALGFALEYVGFLYQ